MNQEDQELLNRLKEKYSGQASNNDATNLDARYAIEPARPSVIAPGKNSSEIDAKICIVCHGTGVKVEDYNNRRLESFCSSCKGKGVNLFRHGVEMEEKAHKVTPAPDSLAQAISEKKSKLQADISAIDDKLAGYLQEKAKLDVGSNTDQDPETFKLAKGFEAQLDAQIAKLSQIRQARWDSLQRFVPQPAVIVE